MENWPTAGGWPTTGLYPPDGSYGGGHGDNHYLPGGGDSPIGDQVPSNRSSARAPPAQFVTCVKELVSKLKDDEKQAGKNDLEALTIEQQAELFTILVPQMGDTFKLRHMRSRVNSRSQLYSGTVYSCTAAQCTAVQLYSCTDQERSYSWSEIRLSKIRSENQQVQENVYACMHTKL